MQLRRIIAAGTLLVTAATGWVLAQNKKGPAATGWRLTLSSPDFEDGGVLPGKFAGGSPKPINPKLEWDHVPEGTVSFALLLHDPDVALQKKTDDVTHWMVFNIPAAAREMPEAVPPDATLPDGSIQIKNVGGRVGFAGPGARAPGPYHHYTFELFALDTKLDLGPDATRAQVFAAMQGHLLDRGVLVARFHR